MKERVLFLLKFWLLTMAVFMVAKVVFMLCHMAEHTFTAADVAAVVGHGLSLDFSTSLYFLIVPFLLTLLSAWVSVPRSVWRIYEGIVAIAFALAFVADTSLYAFWQFKLDASCLQYLQSPTEAMASVSTTYLLLRAALMAVIAYIIYKVYRQLGTPTGGPMKWREALVALVAVPLFVVGIRGGVSESTTNIGQVYYSGNQFLNHSAVNPVFSFLYSLGKSGDYIADYRFFDDAECSRLTAGLFPTGGTPADTLLLNPRPNVLIVVMESCGNQFTEVGGHPEITPNLNRLAHEGISFTQCYANSWRTDRGVVSILSGYPAFPVASVMKLPEKSRKLPSIAKTLSREGYSTSFLYGGDINFTNMRSYVMASGYQRLTWKADFSLDEQASAKWGVRDDIMVDALLSEIEAEPADRPWLKTWLTLSSHEPWDVPTKELDDPVYNAFNYLDRCIGTLIGRLQQLPCWNDLLVVLLPDHGRRYRGIDETTLLYNHIPLLWLGGAVAGPRQVETVCSQSDLAATLLSQMQLPHADFTFSRDVLSPSYRRQVAFHTFVEGITVIDSAGFMAYDLQAAQLMAARGDSLDSRLRLGKAYLQLTARDLIEK